MNIDELLSRCARGERDFSRVNLKEATLISASLIEANLSDADLTGTNLYRANLLDAQMTGVNISDAKLNATIMPDGTIDD